MKKLTTGSFVDRSNIKHNFKFSYLKSKYKNTRSKIIITCKDHGDFQQIAGDHMNGQGCPECKKITLSKIHKHDLKNILIKFKEKHENLYDYSLIHKYYGTDENVSIICKKHGIFKQSSHNHLRGQGCPICYNEKRNTYLISNLEDFSSKAFKIFGNKYDYSKGVYENNKTKIEIVCPIHGSFFKRPNNHLTGEGCPFCFSSIGERKIFAILKGNNIIFTKQKTFKGCKYKKLLKFDFYLPDHNLCIEYNGQQHYKSIEMWGGEKSLSNNIKRDKIKSDYCKTHEIKLIIITYEDDIYEKLKISLNINLIDYIDRYNEYLNFSEAKNVVKELGINSQIEYNEKYKLNNLLPSHPSTIYKNIGWVDWFDFLSKD